MCWNVEKLEKDVQLFVLYSECGSVSWFRFPQTPFHLVVSFWIDVPLLSFLRLGHMGPLPSSHHGPFEEGNFIGALNVMDPLKGPSVSPVGSKQKSNKSAPWDTSVSAVVCRHCGKQFTNLGKFKAHAAYHGKEGRHPCKFCGKAFTFRADKLRHERVHTGEKPFQCSVCDKSFVTNGSLKRHESTHFR